MKRYPIRLVLIIVLGITLFGCSKITIPGGDGEDNTTIDISGAKDGEISIGSKGEDGEESTMDFTTDEEGNTKVTAETDDGQIVSETGEDTEVPEGFPEDFPIPDSAIVSMASTVTEGDYTNYSLSFEFTEDPDEVYKAVKDYAENKGLGIQVDSKTEANGETSYMLGTGESDTDNTEYFIFNIGLLGEGGGSVNYSIPNN